jgi:hypothetical protein
MHIKNYLIFGTIILLSGCTGYMRPGVSATQEAQDEAQCHYEADKATASSSDPVMAGIAESDVETGCMRQRGYTLCEKGGNQCY